VSRTIDSSSAAKAKDSKPSGKRDLLAKAIMHHRTFCMGCGTRIVNEASKRVGLCSACRKHCTACGKETGNFGHFNVCFQCASRIEKTLAYMKAHCGSAPGEITEDLAPVTRAICSACGDPAEHVLDGKPYCDDCRREKEEEGTEEIHAALPA
jgi:hypothetical protein